MQCLRTAQICANAASMHASRTSYVEDFAADVVQGKLYLISSRTPQIAKAELKSGNARSGYPGIFAETMHECSMRPDSINSLLGCLSPLTEISGCHSS